MILSGEPAGRDLVGTDRVLPQSWKKFIAPWSAYRYREHDFGRSLIQELVLPLCSVYIWTLEIERPVRLYPIATEPTIALQLMLHGTVDCKLAGFGEKKLAEGTAELFYVPVGTNEALFENGLYEMVHIQIKPQWLEDISADHEQISGIVSGIGSMSETGIPMSIARIRYTSRAILQNLRACDHSGGSLKLEMHKYVLELLSEYVRELDKCKREQLSFYTPYKDTLLRIRDEILSVPNVHLQTLAPLAARYHLSRSVLKQHFRNLFHNNLSQFVRQHALAKARNLISTTHKSIEEISDEIGYSSREALERAFRKHYGQSPSSIRMKPDR